MILEKKFNIGDTVRFDGGSAFKHAEKRYAKSGVIISFITDNKFIKVYWSNGRITNEFSSYIRHVDCKAEDK